MTLPNSAGVAEHGQTHNKQEGLNARDSRSRPIGVRGFKSHPLHHLAVPILAQISLVLSVKWQKIDFKLWAAFDFARAFKTVNS